LCWRCSDFPCRPTPDTLLELLPGQFWSQSSRFASRALLAVAPISLRVPRIRRILSGLPPPTYLGGSAPECESFLLQSIFSPISPSKRLCFHELCKNFKPSSFPFKHENLAPTDWLRCCLGKGCLLVLGTSSILN